TRLATANPTGDVCPRAQPGRPEQTTLRRIYRSKPLADKEMRTKLAAGTPLAFFRPTLAIIPANTEGIHEYQTAWRSARCPPIRGGGEDGGRHPVARHRPEQAAERKGACRRPRQAAQGRHAPPLAGEGGRYCAVHHLGRRRVPLPRAK